MLANVQLTALIIARLRRLEPGAVVVSARTGQGIDELRARIEGALPHPPVNVEVLVPYDRGEVISRLHVQGRVLSTDYREDGTLVTALVHPARVDDLREFVVGDAS